MAFSLFAEQISETIDITLADIMSRRLRERGGVATVTEGRAEGTLAFVLDETLAPEGFRIEDAGEDTLRICARDAAGWLYGAGKFLRDARYGDGWVAPGSWRGTSTPARPLRAIYFATHFHNFYHDAPIEQVERHIEDLALWGVNTLFVWFDMHHYHSLTDPAAQAMVGRLRLLLTAAQHAGMAAGLTLVANEGYNDSPEALRADGSAGHDGYHTEPQGFYQRELCPHQPGAMELLLHCHAERFAAFAGIDVRYVVLWPYDQGGCTCSLCAPWGANGFLKIAQPLAELFRQHFPAGKVILSTWYFDHFRDGEWAAFDQAFSGSADWADYLLVDDAVGVFPRYPLKHGVPGGLPMVSFPEISMWGAWPWGGFGANPYPTLLQSLWDDAGAHLAGGLPYSEGCFEEINKAICARLYWEDQPALATVEEYLGFEFGAEFVEPLLRAIMLFEQTLPRQRVTVGEITRFVLAHPDGVEEAQTLIRQVDAQLPTHLRASWRWRILYLRAIIDVELVQHDGHLSAMCEEAMRELTAIYAAEQAEYAVAPPTYAALARTQGTWI